MLRLTDSLSREHSMLLLTIFVLEGEKDLELLRYLQPDDASAIQQMAGELGQTPRKQMLPQLVQEIKKLLNDASMGPLEKLDPGWLAEVLQTESPRTISMLMRQMPRSRSEQLFRSLPDYLRKRIPTQQAMVEPEIQKLVKSVIEKRCPTLQDDNPPQKLDMDSITKLSGDEIQVLIRELGFRILAIAFRGAGRGPLTELCRRLGSQESNNLLAIIRRLPESSRQESKAAQKTIRALSLERRTKSEIIIEAGLGRLRAAYHDHPESMMRLVAYRLPRDLGLRVLAKTERLLDLEEQIHSQRIVLQTISNLSEEGRLPAFWQTLELVEPEMPGMDVASLEAQQEL